VVLDSPGSGEYRSVNEAVTAARPQVEASNAYLYMEFQVDTTWILADDLRQRENIGWNPSRAEEEAMRLARDAVRSAAKRKRKTLSVEEVESRAEEVLETHPQFMERGHEIAQIFEAMKLL